MGPIQLYWKALDTVQNIGNEDRVYPIYKGIFRNLSFEQRKIYKTGYQKFKTYGFRTLVGSVEIKDALKLFRDMSLNQVKKYGYQWLAAIFFSTTLPCSTFFVIVLSTSGKILKYATILHHVSCLPAKIFHGSMDIVILPIDYVLLGEEVPSQSKNSCLLLKEWTKRINLGFEPARLSGISSTAKIA